MDYKDVLSLKGKVAWVTGASYGIGFAIASAYAQAGARIAFNDISLTASSSPRFLPRDGEPQRT